MKTIAKLWTGLAVLIVLSPCGLLFSEHFKAGDAWGEWGSDGIKELIGYIPQGLEKLSSLWSAPMPDYAFKGWEEKSLPYLSLAYVVSALAGVAIVVVAAWLIGKTLSRKDDGTCG
jgi:cobalt/nickel transport protein